MILNPNLVKYCIKIPKNLSALTRFSLQYLFMIMVLFHLSLEKQHLIVSLT